MTGNSYTSKYSRGGLYSLTAREGFTKSGFSFFPFQILFAQAKSDRYEIFCKAPSEFGFQDSRPAFQLRYASDQSRWLCERVVETYKRSLMSNPPYQQVR